MQFVIIGAGAAGMNAASILRRKMSDASIDIFSDEEFPFYSRPRLIEVLANESKIEQIYFHPDSWYKSNRINLHIKTPVTHIDTKARKLKVGPGDIEPYDILLLATGAAARVPKIEGNDRPGVFTLRSASDCLAIRDYAEGKYTAAVIGGGLLGLEAAKSLSSLGLEVTVLETNPRILPRQLDAQGAELLQKMLLEQKVHVMVNAQTEIIHGKKAVSEVLLADGSEIPAEIVLISAGVIPNINLAKESGIEVKNGVIVDKHMETSVEGLFSAGDCVEWEGKTWGIIPSALEQSSVAAANMISEKSVEYQGTIPSNNLKVVGTDVTSVGLAVPEKEEDYEIIRTYDEDTGIYKKAVLKDDVAVGLILVGTRKNALPLTNLVKDKTELGDAKKNILNDNFDFSSLE